MPITTATKVNVPNELLADARDRWPVTRDMTNGRLLRYALALALGKTQDEAFEITRDPRIGLPRPHATT